MVLYSLAFGADIT